MTKLSPKERLLLALACLLVAGPLPAQTATDAEKADGKSFGRDTAPAAQGAATTNPDASRIPGFGGLPDQSGYFEDPDRISREAASQASSNKGYQTMRESMDRRARFAPQDLDATIARSKIIAEDPLSYSTEMSAGGTQGRCVALPASGGLAARYVATCNAGYTVDQNVRNCRIGLDINVTENRIYSYFAEVPFHTGLAPLIAQFSAALSNGSCQNIGTADPCEVVRGYGLTPSKSCARYRYDIVRCSTPVAGLTGTPHPATRQLWFSEVATRVATAMPNEGLCANLASDASCNRGKEICTDSDPATRIVDGVAVTQPCWAWSRSYTCAKFTEAQDCQTLEATPGCHLVREDCLTDEPCLTWERVYDCPVPERPTSSNQFICDGDVYCIDGSCETIQREANDEFKDATAALNVMNQARREFDPENLSLFTGKRESCSSQVFGILNCCKGKGFPLIPASQLLVALGCSREEMLLHQKDAAGLCAYVGTYCASSFLGVCLTKRKVYCCFESKLSRILQEQGRQQLNKHWGKPKTEQCLGFTVDEFARLDLSKMDFSEVYGEFSDAARLPDELQATQEIQLKIEDYYARARQ